MPAVLVVRSLSQRNHKFEATLNHMVNSCLKERTGTRGEKERKDETVLLIRKGCYKASIVCCTLGNKYIHVKAAVLKCPYLMSLFLQVLDFLSDCTLCTLSDVGQRCCGLDHHLCGLVMAALVPLFLLYFSFPDLSHYTYVQGFFFLIHTVWREWLTQLCSAKTFRCVYFNCRHTPGLLPQHYQVPHFLQSELPLPLPPELPYSVSKHLLDNRLDTV